MYFPVVYALMTAQEIHIFVILLCSSVIKTTRNELLNEYMNSTHSTTHSITHFSFYTDGLDIIYDCQGETQRILLLPKRCTRICQDQGYRQFLFYKQDTNTCVT